ncbi:hypothetical protein BVG16_27040 [Paenibacillus selenitireducens]|uniref:Uncharacterized protein n=1 Tax=Paenibacillus selenitireducens TaxID=1324314 RepID=A0A1T2X205_9BACL|nr:hypothetical protein [Paenibacillus selenitireducens]OPA73746.1 hypothetical protein BVG16_27040 [Paenibacillus selenitireducens]
MKKVNHLNVAILNYFAAVCFILAGILADGSTSLVAFPVVGVVFILLGSINIMNHKKSNKGSS